MLRELVVSVGCMCPGYASSLVIIDISCLVIGLYTLLYLRGSMCVLLRARIVLGVALDVT